MIDPLAEHTKVRRLVPHTQIPDYYDFISCNLRIFPPLVLRVGWQNQWVSASILPDETGIFIRFW